MTLTALHRSMQKLLWSFHLLLRRHSLVNRPEAVKQIHDGPFCDEHHVNSSNTTAGSRMPEAHWTRARAAEAADGN